LRSGPELRGKVVLVDFWTYSGPVADRRIDTEFLDAGARAYVFIFG